MAERQTRDARQRLLYSASQVWVALPDGKARTAIQGEWDGLLDAINAVERL